MGALQPLGAPLASAGRAAADLGPARAAGRRAPRATTQPAASAQATETLAAWAKTLELRVAEQARQIEALSRLKRFFCAPLAERIMAERDAQPFQCRRCEIVVVFVDLRGFTAFAETAEPEDLMTVLREYQTEVGRLVLEYEGTLEHFAGDGMMIYFNDPVPLANPAERAVRMAIAMRERVGVLKERWRALGFELDLGIGIAQGYASVGVIGFEGRYEYAAIGSVTNLASRLCAQAEGGAILITQRVAAAVEKLLELSASLTLAVKGFSKPISAYSLA